MPPVTGALLGANVLVYLLEYGRHGKYIIDNFALWPPIVGPQIGPDFELWQLVTYGFLHASHLHIAVNMLMLYTFGREVERLVGSVRYLQYYVVCVVAAGICHMIVTGWLPGPHGSVVGASGGVFGVLFAFGYYFPRRIVILLIPPVPMPARVLVILMAAVELFVGVTGTQDGIAHFAHLGGMLGGWLLIRSRRARRRG